jgi:hypothetical protein
MQVNLYNLQGYVIKREVSIITIQLYGYIGQETFFLLNLHVVTSSLWYFLQLFVK